MWTLCPARANCSPHIAPDGPPPTIAISVMFGSSPRPAFAPCARICRIKALSVQRACSGDGENHQAESSKKYSTEDRCGNCRSGLPVHEVHAEPLEDEKEREVYRKEDHQDGPAVKHEDAKHERKKRDQAQC